MSEMTCKQARRLIHLQLDGELTEADRCELDRHLAACGQCARLAQELRQLQGALREGLAATSPQAGLVTAIERRLSRRQPRRRVSRWPYALAAAAVAAAAIVCAVALRHTPASAAAVVASGPGSLHVFPPGSKLAHTAEAGEALAEEAVAWGTDEARVSLEFADGARLDLSKDAVVQMGRRSVTLFKGGVDADLSEARGRFSLSTPWGVCNGAGAVFSLTTSPTEQSARLVVTEGTVSVRTNGRDRVLEAGDSILLRPVSRNVLAL